MTVRGGTGRRRPDTAPAPGPLLGRAIALGAERAAAPGEIRFTERQLYYETCRVLRPAPPEGLARRIPRTPPPPLRLPRFTRALDALGREEMPGLLPEPAANPPVGAARAREPDLYDYGLPRLLVCQDRAIARMLLANHLHLEAACPVLAAEDDLPLDPRLLAALERAQGATVYVLHDASPAGLTLPARVRAEAGAVPGVRVASLGLVPRQAAALHLMSGRRPDPRPALGPLPAGLRPDEVAWLAEGRFTEVAAVRPARLLRTVLRLTRGPRPPRNSVWTELRDLRGAGFMTWPAV
ncbi:hypothetical protein ACFVGN_07955 [Streptomyces sp. NPDC057757]|uniref:hypothetical protein n=1 Tax=Streptomyces sp. NPDC057757 TaxID=3346241 RepID=UPI003687D8EE